jgi:hypothetical protein
MACTDYSDYGEALVEGAFFDAILCPFTDVMGTVAFGLFVYGVALVALYIRTESPTVPIAVLIVTSVVIVPVLPGGALQVMVAVAMLALAIGGYLLTRRAQNAT